MKANEEARAEITGAVRVETIGDEARAEIVVKTSIQWTSVHFERAEKNVGSDRFGQQTSAIAARVETIVHCDAAKLLMVETKDEVKAGINVIIDGAIASLYLKETIRWKMGGADLVVLAAIVSGILSSARRWKEVEKVEACVILSAARPCMIVAAAREAPTRRSRRQGRAPTVLLGPFVA